MRVIEVLAVASDLGVHVDGARDAPAALIGGAWRDRTAQLLTVVAPPFAKQKTSGVRWRNRDGVEAVNRAVYAAATQILARGHSPLLLGGDHAVVMGSILASQAIHGPLGVAWVDAHSDYHTLATTITGNLHGLPLAVITGQEPQLASWFGGDFVDPRACVVLGARSVDQPEWDNLRRAGVRVMTMGEIRRRGLGSVLTEALAIMSAGTRGWHVSFDLDVLDPSLAPGVSVPAAGGLDFSQANEIVRWILRQPNNLVSFDMVEYNPRRDVAGQTLQLAQILLGRVVVGWAGRS